MKTQQLSGLVVAAYGRHCLVEAEDGQRLICHPRGKKNQAVVGDRVWWLPSGDEGSIERLQERRNLLYRQDEIRTKSFAANLDQVLVLLADEEAPQYKTALAEQMAVAQSILNGLGYSGVHFGLIEAGHPQALDAELQRLTGRAAAVPQGPGVAARHAVQNEKRSTLELALDHLRQQASAPLPESIDLPREGAPWGAVVVNADACTLCLSCVSACPAGALQDNPDRPQLRFVERNCVQCGLCAKTCPEHAIQLQPRLLLTPQRQDARVVNEQSPYACVRCGKPFGTLKGVEAMLARLSGHSMFQGAALERLKMCGDCRVVDIFTAENEVRIAPEQPKS